VEQEGDQLRHVLVQEAKLVRAHPTERQRWRLAGWVDQRDARVGVSRPRAVCVPTRQWLVLPQEQGAERPEDARRGVAGRWLDAGRQGSDVRGEGVPRSRRNIGWSGRRRDGGRALATGSGLGGLATRREDCHGLIGGESIAEKRLEGLPVGCGDENAATSDDTWIQIGKPHTDVQRTFRNVPGLGSRRSSLESRSGKSPKGEPQRMRQQMQRVRPDGTIDKLLWDEFISQRRPVVIEGVPTRKSEGGCWTDVRSHAPTLSACTLVLTPRFSLFASRCSFSRWQVGCQQVDT